MLIQLVTQHPEAIPKILGGTPGWVWGLLGGLVFLGATQVSDRNVSLARIAVMPVAMVGLAVYGMVSAFGSSPNLAGVLATWLALAVVVAGIVSMIPVSAATRYDSATRRFDVPGSWLPMALILGIFLVKYIVGVEVAMQPRLASDADYTLAVGAIYGAFNGIFTGRSLRLLKLTRGDGAVPVAA